MRGNVIEKNETVYPVIKRAYCEVCEHELMKTGKALYTSPLQYEYICNNENCSEYNVPFTNTTCYPSIEFLTEDGLNVNDTR